MKEGFVVVEHHLNILFLEDNSLDVDLAVAALRQAGIEFDYQNVDSRQAFVDCLDDSIDVILADYTLPQYDAIKALHDLQESGFDIPVIVITGTISEEVAVECIKQGAADYLLKDRLTRLVPAITHALEEKKLRLAKAQAEEDLRASEERYRFLAEFSPDPIILYYGDEIAYVNQAGLQTLGASSLEEMLGKTSSDLISPGEEDKLSSRDTLLYQGKAVGPAVFSIERLDGKNIFVEAKTSPIDLIDESGRQAFLTVFRDVTDRLQHEKELKAIATISEALRMAASLEEMVPVTMDQIMVLLDLTAVRIVLFDAASGENTFVAGRGVWSDLEDFQFVMGAGFAGHVFQTGQTYINNNVRKNLDDSIIVHKELAVRVKAIAGIPLIAQDMTIGVIGIGKESDITEYDIRLLKAIGDMAGSALQRAFLEEDMEANFVETVLALANTLEVRHTQTADHSQRMALWAVETLRLLGGSEGDLRNIRFAAILHDIGKIGIEDQVFQKPGPLTDEEWEIMKTHPVIGAEIVAPIQKLSDVAPIIRAHQEKYDGTGYPSGLKEEEIPLAARVLTTIDAYGAMIEDRIYRPARSKEEAREELEACAGADFDPHVVEAFIRVLKEIGEV
jgi:PAS domain S-box-containing protein/putative nucleotidyltransferase with HDIG domain